MTKLSVIIPSYNETAELKKQGIDAVEGYLTHQQYDYEVLIIDDGSTNGSREVVKDYLQGKKGFRLIENTHGGKALTVMTGMLEAKGEVAVFTDMDQATPLNQIEKFFPKFEEGFEVVNGSRIGRKGAPITRRFVAFSFATLRNLILGLPSPDTQCGFKAFNKKARDEIFAIMRPEWEKAKSKGAAVNAGFDVEILYIAKKKGFKIADVEVNWHHIDVGAKQVSVVSEGINALKDMLRIRWNDLKGKYH